MYNKIRGDDGLFSTTERNFVLFWIISWISYFSFLIKIFGSRSLLYHSREIFQCFKNKSDLEDGLSPNLSQYDRSNVVDQRNRISDKIFLVYSDHVSSSEERIEIWGISS